MLHHRLLLCLLLLSAAAPARAQDRALATFESGSVPVAIPTLGADGNLYGTTSQGGNAGMGMVYRLTPGGNLTTLVSFSGTNGRVPTTPLVLGKDGNFYGTTSRGNHDDGTIYRVTPQGDLATVYTFSLKNQDAPSALTAGPDGAFYGTLRQGGQTGKGSVFRFDPTSGFRTLAEFADTTGTEPLAPLVLGRDGGFYGVTSMNGKIFRVTPDGAITVRASFNYAASGGASSNPLVEDANGNLYGVSAGVYPSVKSGVFKVALDGTFTVPVQFNQYYPTGSYQPNLALGPDGNLYGITPSGDGTGYGSVFQLTPDGKYTTLARTGIYGGTNLAGLRLAPDGAFYGVARNVVSRAGQPLVTGSIFRVTTAGTLTTVHEFNQPQGYFPNGGLLRAADGNFYGINALGSDENAGNIYRVTPAGVSTSLVEFGESYGERGKLCPDAAGTSLYGVSQLDDASGNGTVFRVALSDGTGGTIHTFKGSDGKTPQGGVVRGADDAFYGVTSAGGTAGKGTVFRVTAAGAFTSLHSFNGTTEGGAPTAGLTVGADGALYGATANGGASGRGAVFRVTAAGSFAVLASLPSTSGAPTDSPLVFGPDGNLYGMTKPVGEDDSGDHYGTAFRVTPAGTFTTLLSFGGWKLHASKDGLALGPDGNLYGTLSDNDGEGVLFRLTTSGTLTILRRIPGATQAYGGNIGAPVFGDDGTIYGVANHAVWHLPTTSAADTWRQRYFGNPTNEGNAADNADPDGDGASNLLERAFGLNPLAPDAANAPAVTYGTSNGRLTLSARRGPDAADLVFTAESSADLVTWSATDTTVLYDGAALFQAQDNGPAGNRRFLRLRVTRP